MSKIILLASTCNLPAKCLVPNTSQFNGKHGYNKCLQPVVSHTTSRGGHTHVYPYDSNNPTGPKRNKTNHKKDASTAAATNIVNGVKGPSWLMILREYDIIRGTAIDYMHCVLLGVTKLLLILWFGSEHKKRTFYIGKHLAAIDKRIKEIRVPSAISRTPRAISQHLKYLKASEYRAFLLYYSLPVLAGVLPSQFWNHYSLLVTAISLLLKQSISEQEIDYCQLLLSRFCSEFSILYGKRYMSANIHLLLHLPETVKDLGPLWVYSCFHFEGQNGILKNTIHGTQKWTFNL